MEEFPEIRYWRIPRWFLPVFLFSFVLASAVVVYKNQSKFAFGKIFGDRVVEAQEGINMLDYLRGPDGSSYPVGTETFRYMWLPGDRWRVYKNSNYEAFTFSNGQIRRNEDTSWAPRSGFKPAFCSDEVTEADYTLVGGHPQGGESLGDFYARVGNIGANFVPNFMSEGDQVTNVYTVVPIRADTLNYCELTSQDRGYVGPTSQTVQFEKYYPNFEFCNGKSLPDVIKLTVVAGSGLGDVFYFAKGVGFVGFEHSVGERVVFRAHYGGDHPDCAKGVIDEWEVGCVTSIQTPLFPGTKELKGKENATLLLKEGFGNVAGIMSVESVTVADYIQGTDIEPKGETPVMPKAAENDKVLSFDAFYDVKPNYPADGTVEAEANITVASWVNSEYITANNLGDEYIPLDTGNVVSDFPEGSSGYGEGFGVIKKADYVYFPLGTALGAIAQDPYNFFTFYERPSDFVTGEKVVFSEPFVGGQTAHVNFFIDALDKLLSFLGEISRLLGIRGIFDIRLGTPNPKSAVMDGNEVNIAKYYRGDRAPGEQGIELGEFIFQQDCETFDGTVGRYDSAIIGFENEKARIRGCTAGEPDCPADKISAISELNRKIDSYRTQQGKVGSLARECHGEGKRRAKIEGKLSLTAPFVPILAHERLQDVLYTSGRGDPRPVCSAPEEGLYAAEVKVNVKFYDRNQAKFNAYKTCEDGENLLTDGFMETAGKGFPGVSGNVPGGWDAFWKKKPDRDGDFSDYGKAPEFVIQGRDPDPRRVLQGNTALKWFTAFSTHDVVMYEIIDLGLPERSYDISGYYQGWRVQYDSPDTGPCPLSDPSYTGGSFSEVCVIEVDADKTPNFSLPSQTEVGEAEFDSWVSRFINNNQYAHCSRIEEGMDQWNEHFVRGVFRGKVMILVRGASPIFPVEVNDDYWDNFCFVPSGNLFEQEYESIEIPEPEIEIGECPLVKRPLGSCKIEGIGGVSDTATLINEDLDFYMPGLGVIPFLRERIVVGEGKSPDRKATDYKYCEVDPEKPFPFPVSYLDIYIIQNLQPESLAIKWAEAIYPKFEEDEVVAIRQGEPIEQDPRFAKLWEEMEEKNKAEINGGEVWIE